MLEIYDKHAKKKLAATILAVLVIAGAVIFADHGRATRDHSSDKTIASHSAPTTQTVQTPAASTATAPAVSSNTSGYKDGDYSASSNYYVPHSIENIGVNLTLKDGVITDVSIQNSESDFTSARYQERFTAAYKTYVIGQKISDLKLGVVAGASDTTRGFDQAISQIASRAQA